MRLTKKGFVAWLRKKKAGAIVGLPAQPLSCPLAVYIRSLKGGEHAQVYGDKIEYEVHDVPLPQWACRFVAAVDSDTLVITGQHALELLGEKR